MPRSPFIDFRAVKSAITMEQLLQHYNLIDQFKRSGDNLSGPCPIHKGSNPTQFRVSTSKNIWNCFSKCDHGGNTLDFIAKMENVSIHAGALKAIEWFKLDLDAMSGNSDDDGSNSNGKGKQRSEPKPKPTDGMSAPDGSAPNVPLKFKLEKLQRDHPYLTERGLSLETIIDFGIGYCAKGILADRVAIPIHNPEGAVVAYAGRLPGQPTESTPKYKLPQGFRKSLELFNVDRAFKEPAEHPLIIVEGFFDCMKLHQNGCRKVVALMGSTMSAAQEELIRKRTNRQSRVIVLLDEDEAGRAGREDIASRLINHCFVRVVQFGIADTQPEQLSADELREITGGVL